MITVLRKKEKKKKEYKKWHFATAHFCVQLSSAWLLGNYMNLVDHKEEAWALK